MTTPTPGPGSEPVTPVAPAAPIAPAVEPAAPPPVTPVPEPPHMATDTFDHQSLAERLGLAKPAAETTPAPVAQQPAQEAAPPPTPASAEPPAAPPVPAAPEQERFGQELLTQIRADFRAQYPADSDAVIDRLANNELDRRKQQSEKSKLLTRLLKPKTEAPALTAFEQSLQPPPPAPGAAPAAPHPPAAPQPPAQPEPPAMPDYMRSEEAAEEEFMVAVQAGDARKAAEVRANIDAVRAWQHEKAMMRRVEAMVAERLAPTLATTQKITAAEKAEADTEFAISFVEKNGHPEIRRLYEPLSQEPLEINGERYPDTALNRIVLQHPYINTINVQKETPEQTSRATRIARYDAVIDLYNRFYKSEAPEPSVAPTPAPIPQTTQPPNGTQLPAIGSQEAIDMARRILERELADRARQGLNSGPGASISQPATRSSIGTALQDPTRNLDDVLGLRRR